MKFILILIVGIGVSCERVHLKKEHCSMQGFYARNIKLTCKNKIKASTVEFSNGESRNLIQGGIKLNNENYSFSILLDKNEVKEYNFPLKSIDSSGYSCKVRYPSANLVEIEWKNATKRLFLRKKLTQ